MSEEKGENLMWTQPEWLAEVHAWIRAELARQGTPLTGAIAQAHVRPWSTVMKIPTPQGVLYFKASMPVLGYEAALTRRLAQLAPGCIVQVRAVDPARGWMILANEGDFLRSRVSTTADLHHWEKILPRFAQLQIDLIPHGEELRQLGLLDRRLAGLPGQFEKLLEDRAALMIGQPNGLTPDRYERLVALPARFADLCARLAGSGIPETLHHDDFHDANVFVSEREGRLRYAFSDWVESCITHPFFSLLVTLRSIAYRLDLAYGSAEHDFAMAPELLHLRDRYLEPWSSYGSLSDLREICNLAWRAAMVNRALTWHLVLTSVPPDHRSEVAHAVPAWMEEFVDLITHDDQKK